MYNAIDIAKCFINKTHPKLTVLQKQLYLAQGYHYAFYNEPLFKESILAESEGPIIESIQKAYKQYGDGHIRDEQDERPIGAEALEAINHTIDVVSKYNEKALDKMVRNQDPVYETRMGFLFKDLKNNVIDTQFIANYFTNEVYGSDEDDWD